MNHMADAFEDRELLVTGIIVTMRGMLALAEEQGTNNTKIDALREIERLSAKAAEIAKEVQLERQAQIKRDYPEQWANQTNCYRTGGY